METKDLLKVSELAPLLGVTSGRVYQLIAEGEVPATRVGRALRVPRVALDAWLARCAEESQRNARQTAARRAMLRPEPATDTERAIAAAVQELAQDRPFGFRGSATELLEQLQAHRPEGAGDLALFPADGRALSVVLRRLVVYLQRNGVQVTLGRRSFRGKRIVSILVADNGTVAGTRSVASGRHREKAAPSKGTGSAHSRSDGRVTGFTGTILIDADVLAEIERSRDENASPTTDRRVRLGSRIDGEDGS
jgi:excisionase family DNA binding protein